MSTRGLDVAPVLHLVRVVASSGTRQNECGRPNLACILFNAAVPVVMPAAVVLLLTMEPKVAT